MKRLSKILDFLRKSLKKIEKPRRKALLNSMILFFLLMPLLWYTSFWYEDVLIKELKTRLTIHANIHGNALTTAINKRFALLEGLFAFTMSNPSDEVLKKNFDVFSSGLYSSAKGIRNFALAPGGVQRYVYPFRGNDATLGHNLINDPRPEVRFDVLRAINTREIVISGPYELRQGGLGLVARKALYVNDTFWGLVTMAIDMPPIFEEAVFYPQPDDIEMALRGSSGNIIWGNRSIFENQPVKLRIELPEGYWELGAIPPGGWHKAVANTLLEFQATGLIFLILIAIIIYLFISRYLLLDENNKYLKLNYLNLEHEVAERKQAEDALRDNEQRLSSIYNTVGDVIFHLEVENEGQYRFVSVNPSFCRVTGLSKEQIVGKTVTEVIPEPSLTMVLGKYRQAIETKNIVRWEEVSDYPIGRLTGEVSIAPVFDDKGRCTHLVGSVHDITKRKQVEVMLRESEERYRNLFDNANEAIFVAQDGKLAFINPMTTRMIGYSGEDLMSRSFVEFIHPDDRGMVIDRHVRRTKGEEFPQVYSFRIIRGDGKAIWVELNTVVVNWEGKPATLNFLSDITERKRAEEQIFVANERLQFLLSSTSAVIYAAKSSGDFGATFISDNVIQIAGYNPDEFTKDSNFWFDHVHPEDQPIILEEVPKLFEKGFNVIEYRFRCRDGRYIWVNDQMKPVRDNDGKLIEIIGFWTDISERKRTEEALKESENRYRELSIVDDLTQLYNSRHFYHQLKMEINRSDRYGQPLTLMLLDLDDFKQFNDSCGHIEGDQVLLRLGQVIKRCLRQTDTAYRYGGEEFTILLPLTQGKDSAVTAERIRMEFKKETFSLTPGQDIHVTVSIGHAQYKPREDMKVFVQRVDQLMYQAKKDGKDRVCSES